MVPSPPSIGYHVELRGFGVWVGASGSLGWFIEYRPGAGGDCRAAGHLAEGGDDRRRQRIAVAERLNRADFERR